MITFSLPGAGWGLERNDQESVIAYSLCVGNLLFLSSEELYLRGLVCLKLHFVFSFLSQVLIVVSAVLPRYCFLFSEGKEIVILWLLGKYNGCVCLTEVTSFYHFSFSSVNCGLSWTPEVPSMGFREQVNCNPFVI